MRLRNFKTGLRWLGGLAALSTLAVIFQGLWRGVKRPTGRSSGRTAAWLRGPAFYVATGAGYFGLCALLWRPLPRLLAPSVAREWLGLVLGALIYFPGLALMLCGRLALGRMYFVSTTGGTHLFADHRLVTHGPYAWVRHPMYLGLLLVSLGGLLIYQTWTWVLVTLNFPVLMLRARREVAVLHAEFGTLWEAYCRRVPAWCPLLGPVKQYNLQKTSR